FLFRRVPVCFYFVESLGDRGDESRFIVDDLGQNSATCNVGSICVENKAVLEVWKADHWRVGESAFQLGIGSVGLVSPFEWWRDDTAFASYEKSSYWAHDVSEKMSTYFLAHSYLCELLQPS
ncbi:unnamed protein product, partial [Oikopleura dioica]